MYELVRDSVEVRALGPAALKGKAAPTMVWELIGVVRGVPSGEGAVR